MATTVKQAFAFTDATIKSCPAPITAEVQIDVDEPGSREVYRVRFFENRCKEIEEKRAAWIHLLSRAEVIDRECPYSDTVQLYCKSKGGVSFVFVVAPESEWPAVKVTSALAQTCGAKV